MKKNNFLKHFMIIGSGTFINMLIGLFTTPLITRIVDPIEYGRLSIFTMYSNIGVMILCLGLDQALVRYYYDCKELKDKKKLLLQCIFLPIVISILVGSIMIWFSYKNWINFEFDTFFMVLLCIYTWIQIIYRFSLLIIRLEYRSKLYSILNIILKIIYVSAALFFITLFQKNHLFFLIFSTIFSSFVCMLISILAQRKIWNFFSNTSRMQTISMKELVKYSTPFIISMGITTLFQAIDKISLNYYCDYAVVGIYSSAMSLVHIFALVQSTFNTLWSPVSIEHFTKNPKDTEFYVKANQVITFVMFFLGVSLILFKDVFSLLLGEKYREAAYILPFLIFNPIMYTISETTVCGMVFKKKSNFQVVVAIGACIVNMLGNFILVPLLGGKGAAISTGISYIVFFSLRTYFSNLVFFIPFDLKKIYFLTVLTILYALYNTFIPFHFLTVFIYIFLICVMLIIYRHTILWILDYVKFIFSNRKANY